MHDAVPDEDELLIVTFPFILEEETFPVAAVYEVPVPAGVAAGV